jgi:hypothetical protein
MYTEEMFPHFSFQGERGWSGTTIVFATSVKCAAGKTLPLVRVISNSISSLADQYLGQFSQLGLHFRFCKLCIRAVSDVLYRCTLPAISVSVVSACFHLIKFHLSEALVDVETVVSEFGV